MNLPKMLLLIGLKIEREGEEENTFQKKSIIALAAGFKKLPKQETIPQLEDV